MVDFADRNRYWRSRVTQGSAWNDISSTEAVNNAKGAFPDDYYDFTISAYDAAGNITPKTIRVLLDNWEQTLGVVSVASPTDFVLAGSEFLGNTGVPIYALHIGESLNEGDTIGEHATFLGIAPTNANGDIVNFPVTLVGGDVPIFVADYAGDGIYEPRLDAIVNARILPRGGFRAVWSSDLLGHVSDSTTDEATTDDVAQSSSYFAPDSQPILAVFSSPIAEPKPVVVSLTSVTDPPELAPKSLTLSTTLSDHLAQSNVDSNANDTSEPDDLLSPRGWAISTAVR